MACLDENAVSDYAGGAMSAKARLELIAHTDECLACRTLLSSVLRSDPSGALAEPAVEAGSLLNVIRRSQPDWSGRTIGGKYRLGRSLGSGGMGAVYEA